MKKRMSAAAKAVAMGGAALGLAGCSEESSGLFGGIMTALFLLLMFIVFFVVGPVMAYRQYRSSPFRKAMSLANSQREMLAILAPGDVVMLSNGQSGEVVKLLGENTEIRLDDGKTFVVNKNLIMAKQ